jgi:hypothetical protein
MVGSVSSEEVAKQARSCERYRAARLVTTKQRRGADQHFYMPTELLLSVPWLVTAIQASVT